MPSLSLRFALAVVMLCGVAVASYSQESKLAPDVPNPRVKTRYDRFSDMTSVTLSIRIISGGIVDLGGGSVYAPSGIGRDLELAVLGIVEGQDLKKTIPKVTLVVTSRSDEWLYLRSPNLLQAIVDGNTRVTIGDMKRITSEVDARGRGVIEQLSLEVPFGAVEKLSPGTVSPGCGMRPTLPMRSRLIEPRTVIMRWPSE